MSTVNLEMVGLLLVDFGGWADMTPDDIRSRFPEWNPNAATYEPDLEAFVRARAASAIENLHPEALDMVKAAMRWLLRDAPEYACEWYDDWLCGPERTPVPMSKMFEWAWLAVFGDEPWDIEGEDFELCIDYEEAAFYTKKAWGERPPPNPHRVVWPRQ